MGIARARFYDWRRRRGAPNRHNAPIPKDGWLLEWEKDAILDFYFKNSGEGYRRLAWMMVVQDVVAVSPARRDPGRTPTQTRSGAAALQARTPFDTKGACPHITPYRPGANIRRGRRSRPLIVTCFSGELSDSR